MSLSFPKKEYNAFSSGYTSPFLEDVFQSFQRERLPVALMQGPSGQVFKVISRQVFPSASPVEALVLEMKTYAKAFFLTKSLLESRKADELLLYYVKRDANSPATHLFMKLIPKEQTLFSQAYEKSSPMPVILPHVFETISAEVEEILKQKIMRDHPVSIQQLAPTDLAEVVTKITMESHPPQLLSALDLGCGEDVMSSLFCNLLGWKVLALDSNLSSKKMWKERSSQLPQGSRSFALGEITDFLKKRIDEDREGFSLVYAINSFHFFPSIEKIEEVLKLAFQVLHPGGAIYILTPTDVLPSYKAHKEIAEMYFDAVPYYGLKQERYFEALLKAGFTNIRHVGQEGETIPRNLVSIVATKEGYGPMQRVLKNSVSTLSDSSQR